MSDEQKPIEPTNQTEPHQVTPTDLINTIKSLSAEIVTLREQLQNKQPANEEYKQAEADAFAEWLAGR